MYLKHFGLLQPPFKITPNTGFFYPGGNRGAILEALLYAVTNGEGLIKVTGEIGSGKTMLCRMLISLLPENVETICLINPSLNRDDVFHAIAGELGLVTEGKRAGDILHLINDYLIRKHTAGKQIVLMVEEAQAMPLDTLEEIRLLSNLETGHDKLLQIVLFGQPELDENLAVPKMRQLRERITHSFTVPPLSEKNIPEYLMFRMRAAGYRGPDLFDRGTTRLITSASGGITRRINILADKTLLAAFADGTSNLLPKHVKAAIKDSSFTLPRRNQWRIRLTLAALILVALGVSAGAAWQRLTLPSGDKPQQAEPARKADLAATGAPENPRGLLEQKMAISRELIEKENGDNFTISLLLLTDPRESQLENILRRLTRETASEQLYLYPTSVTEDRQFRIIFGNFPTRGQALAAFAGLPPAYRRNAPKLRTIAGIRNEIAKR